MPDALDDGWRARRGVPHRPTLAVVRSSYRGLAVPWLRLRNSAVLQNRPDRSYGPLLSGRYYPHPTVIARANESVGANLVLYSNKLQVRVGLPVQRQVDVAWKDLPLRAVVQLNKVTLGMLVNLHGLSGLAISVAKGVARKIDP